MKAIKYTKKAPIAGGLKTVSLASIRRENEDSRWNFCRFYEKPI